MTSQGKRGPKPEELPKLQPYHPAGYSDEDAYAVQAFMQGRASEAQQLRAAKFILFSICGTYDLSYRPESPHDTAFAEGKRFVGLQLVKFVHLDLAKLRGKNTEQGEAPKEHP